MATESVGSFVLSIYSKIYANHFFCLLCFLVLIDDDFYTFSFNEALEERMEMTIVHYFCLTILCSTELLFPIEKINKSEFVVLAQSMSYYNKKSFFNPLFFSSMFLLNQLKYSNVLCIMDDVMFLINSYSTVSLCVNLIIRDFYDARKVSSIPDR